MDPHALTVVVYARDFDTSLDFYAVALGLRELGRWDRPESKGARFAAGDGGVIEVFGAPGAGLDEATRVGGVSIALTVDGVDGWYARLCSAGIECTEPSEEWWGGRCVYVFDPNGLTILLSEERRMVAP